MVTTSILHFKPGPTRPPARPGGCPPSYKSQAPHQPQAGPPASKPDAQGSGLWRTPCWAREGPSALQLRLRSTGRRPRWLMLCHTQGPWVPGGRAGVGPYFQNFCYTGVQGWG